MHLSAYMQVRWFSLLWIFKVITDIQSKALYNTSYMYITIIQQGQSLFSCCFVIFIITVEKFCVFCAQCCPVACSDLIFQCLSVSTTEVLQSDTYKQNAI